jgi:hypothetical protein
MEKFIKQVDDWQVAFKMLDGKMRFVVSIGQKMIQQ